MRILCIQENNLEVYIGVKFDTFLFHDVVDCKVEEDDLAPDESLSCMR
jgi:hypothetical protein